MARIIRDKGRLYDTKTSNESFLKVATDLKKAGVVNWYFMLEIKDVSLINVDPYAEDDNGKPTLSQNTIEHIIFECRNNPWYYLREVARIVEQGLTHGISYRANRGNIAQAWCLLHGIDSWLCLPRQQGKTQSALAMLAWAYSFGTSQSTFIFVNKDGEQAKENLRRIKDQIDLLPVYLQFEAVMIEDMDEDGNPTKPKIVKAIKNATKMQHPVSKNQIIVKSKATSYEHALSLARGLTAPIIYYDEPEFTSHIKTIVENSVSTFRTAADNSKKHGAIYGRIFTCTPGDQDTEAGVQSEKLLASTVKWTEQMYNWSPKRREEYIKANDSNHIVYIEYDYHQIGKTEAWFRDIAAEINDPLTVRREILLQRLRGSDNSPYEREDIEAIIEMERKPISEFYLREYYRVDVYEMLDRNIPYLVGVDNATGSGGKNDSNAFTVVNPYTLLPVAEFECNFIGETEWEEALKELVREHIPKAILCIERNHVGDGIVDHLCHSPYVNNVYFDKDKFLMQDKMKENETIEERLNRQAMEKTFYGVWTMHENREIMFTILGNHIANHKDKFVTHNITRDITRLVRTKGGKIVAGPGFHDDSIMSYLIAMYVYYHGNNLALFGFDKSTLHEQTEKNQGFFNSFNKVAVDSLNVPEEVKDIIRMKQERAKQTESYEDILRRALYEEQQEAIRIEDSSLNIETSYGSNPNNAFSQDIEFGANRASIPYSFFREINQ